jgi:hypothetical protein
MSGHPYVHYALLTALAIETTDRAGNPLRIVHQTEAPSKYAKPDQGGVYEFPLPTT